MAPFVGYLGCLILVGIGWHFNIDGGNWPAQVAFTVMGFMALLYLLPEHYRVK